MKAVVAAAALTGLLLAGCGQESVGNGPVLAKHFEPAHDVTSEVPIYGTMCTGSPVVCTQYVMSYIPSTDHVGPQWSIKVQGAKRTGWENVTQYQYDHIQVGDVFEGASNG